MSIKTDIQKLHNPQDAVQLLEVAQQLVPNDPVVEHKLQQLS